MNYNKRIEFKDCTLYHRGDYTTIIYKDGETSNWPHPDDEFYKSIAQQCGFGTTPEELMNYCYEHEFCHLFVPLKLHLRESYVASRASRHIRMSESAAMSEEYLVYIFQRYKAFPNQYQPLDSRWPDMAKEANNILYSKDTI